MSLLLLFNGPTGTTQAGDRCRFYLLSGAADRAWPGAFVILPGEVQVEDQRYVLMLAQFDADTNDLVISANPQPASWDGTVPQARRLLREHDLTPWWWLFDAFLAAHGAVDAEDYRDI